MSTQNRKRPVILKLSVEYEKPFVPQDIGRYGCSAEEYLKGRENDAVRQCMRNIARLMVEEKIKTIQREAENAGTQNAVDNEPCSM